MSEDLRDSEDPPAASDGAAVAEDDPPPFATPPATIFISYRVHPDQPVAIALRRLIESSIEPSPEVFVSGAGGLRPSEIGFKPQLQQAVQRARAFVGIFTQASEGARVDVFEAGAAWGRNQIYVPLLVDTSPQELASSVADYQAVRASVSDEISALIDKLADAVGGQAKRSFAKRYQAFERAIATYKHRDPQELKEEESSHSIAFRLLSAGKVDEGNSAFDKLEAGAGSDEERAVLRFDRLLASKDTDQVLLEKLESVPENLHQTAVFCYWRGVLEPRPLTAIASLEKALTFPDADAYHRRASTIELARRNFSIGRVDEAQRILARALRSEDRHLRCGGVEKWIELFPKLDPEARLALLFFAFTAKRAR